MSSQPSLAESVPRRMVSGWLPYWTMADALEAATANGDLWGTASPFWYQATGSTTIVGQPGAGDQALIGSLRAAGIEVLPTITETMDAPAMAALLGDQAQRAAHVQALVNLATGLGVDGIDLDYESMNFGGTPADKAAVRTGFVTLVGELGAALNTQDMTLSVTVGPRTSELDLNWAVFDYAGIAAAADLVRIMTYDLHYRGGPPGPIAPLPWVHQVLGYAVTVIPAAHIQVGVPLYGYDWQCETPACTTQAAGAAATALTYEQAEALRTAKGAVREWSAADAAALFRYTDDAGRPHVVWYNDHQSTQAKMSLVGAYRLAGLAFWAVGFEDTGQWKPLRDYATSIAKKSRTISISVPSSVGYGTKVTVKGTVRNASGTALIGHPVMLQRRWQGGGGWIDVASGSSSPAGTVALTYTPLSNSVFRLVAPEDWTYLAASSAERTTGVKWKVTATAGDTSPPPLRTVTISGTVSPRRAGTTVERQKYQNRSWVTVSSTVLDVNGRYRFQVWSGGTGTMRYRIKVPGTAYNATGYSPTITFTVG
ncbi:MAG TPA: glycosyl hydrolase family 18 protein [Actinomycetes bacterium]|nr:glycosyl hydrolase family 18 protein [Actinomycetes bacterium]